MTPKEKAIQNLNYTDYMSKRDKALVIEAIDIALKAQAEEYEGKYKEALKEVEIIGMSNNEIGLRIIKITELKERHKKALKAQAKNFKETCDVCKDKDAMIPIMRIKIDKAYKEGFKAGLEACKPNKKLDKAIKEGVEV